MGFPRGRRHTSGGGFFHAASRQSRRPRRPRPPSRSPPHRGQRGGQLEAAGFRPFEALHVACAERARVDVLLTTDDKLVRLATRLADQVRVTVKNPLAWILEEIDR